MELSEQHVSELRVELSEQLELREEQVLELSLELMSERLRTHHLSKFGKLYCDGTCEI